MNDNTPNPPVSGQSQLSIEEAYAQAVDHFNAKRYHEADQLCTAIIQLVPNQIDTINLLGVIAQQVNRHDLAVELFQRAINLDNKRAILHYNLATSLDPSGQKEAAMAALKAALEIEPDNRSFADYLQKIDHLTETTHKESSSQQKLNQGEALLESGQWDEAIACYRSLLELEADNPSALANLGRALQAKGAYDEGIDCFQKAIAAQPNFAEAHYYLANTLAEKGEINPVAEYYKKAIALKPGYAEAFSHLGGFYVKLNNLPLAEVYLKRAMTLSPDCPQTRHFWSSLLKKKAEIEASN
ncbi:MAG: tetratricopeptide repeat protein [Magnetococcales bacterium]|nr:tetratricopeptide repeat protein [Magnetococcales bacterium]